MVRERRRKTDLQVDQKDGLVRPLDALYIDVDMLVLMPAVGARITAAVFVYPLGTAGSGIEPLNSRTGAFVEVFQRSSKLASNARKLLGIVVFF